MSQPIPIVGVCATALTSDPDTQCAVDLYRQLQEELSSALENNISKLELEPSWALLHAMSGRAMEQQAACIALYSHGYYAPAEALCRTVIEASVNLYYCSLGDSCSLILTYFRSHIETERKQNKSWQASVNSSAYPMEAKRDHLLRITNKEDALNKYEHVLTEAFSQIGLSYSLAAKEWPSIFDRFKAINKEVGYRTVYAALCSQAHNDAEDLLNDFVHSVCQVEGAHKTQAAENKNFSLYMVLMGLAYLTEATVIYLAKYNLNVNEPFQKIIVDVWTAIERVTQRKHSIVAA